MPPAVVLQCLGPEQPSSLGQRKRLRTHPNMSLSLCGLWGGLFTLEPTRRGSAVG